MIFDILSLIIIIVLLGSTVGVLNRQISRTYVKSEKVSISIVGVIFIMAEANIAVKLMMELMR